MLFTREALLDREVATLAPYATLAARSRGRRYAEAESVYRTPYQRDRDRVLHTTAFRRLEYKTQVFVNDEGDHYRTRLTHTLEVTQVARSVAVALGLNETLAETIALAHDLGHAPFGHAGERILHEIMRDFGGFEHNRQSLRIVTKLEARVPEVPGLNLTWETLEGIAKHESLFETPETSDIPEYEPTWRPSLEAQLANVADETAYNAHDLDDGLRSGLLTPHALGALPLWQATTDRLGLHPLHLSAQDRRVLIRELLGWMITDLTEESARRIDAAGVHSLMDVRRADAPLIGHSASAREQLAELKRFLFQELYRHPRVVRQIHKAEVILTGLFSAYRRRPTMLPREFQARIETTGLERTVCDYLAGMTDRYAADEYRRLFDASVRT